MTTIFPNMNQSKNNGICTANLAVNPYGWNQKAQATWPAVEPLSMVFGDTSWNIIDYDKAPLVKGVISLTCEDDEVFSQDLATDHKHAFWTYPDLIKECVVQVPYGETRSFTLTISGVIFSSITGQSSNNTKTLTNIALDVRDTFMFRQRDDTGSYGSETEKYLFWPWQNER